MHNPYPFTWKQQYNSLLVYDLILVKFNLLFNKLIKLFIYKIFMENDYKLFVSRGYTRGSILDKKDGFIHLSARYQLIGTINKHFFLVK